MNKVNGAIPNLTNAMRVYAALDIQSGVKGKIVEGGIMFTDANPVQWEMHGITFKRTSDNHLVRLHLTVERGESSCDGERYGAPSIRLHGDVTHEADLLVSAVVSLFGGAVQVYPEREGSGGHPLGRHSLHGPAVGTQNPGRTCNADQTPRYDAWSGT